MQRIAAFSRDGRGGNPAGVAICEHMPSAAQMLRVAKAVSYSETAFLEPQGAGWRIRYFAPEMEVPFCGHATIASGAALGERFGAGVYSLYLNEGEIMVRVSKSNAETFTTTLRSPNTWSAPAPQAYVNKILEACALTTAGLDPRFPVSFAFAGAKHLVVALGSRQLLAELAYDFDRLKAIMSEEDLVTINVVWCESQGRFHSRNPFPTGGVYEDPATGAAAAALAGYLRDLNWPGPNRFEVLQGEDMGVPSQLWVEYTEEAGEGVEVTGETRTIEESGVEIDGVFDAVEQGGSG